MMKNNPLLSIIIPTKNRQVYCLESIKNILKNIDYNCEIVIQDNSDNNSLKNMISQINDERLIYHYYSFPISFIDNFEKAISFSEGEYFIILGDDDTVTKDIIILVNWMKNNNIESVAGKSVVDYIWPNNYIEKYKNGEIKIPDFSSQIIYENPKENLKKLIRNGFLSYQDFHLPRTYHGIVKRSVMDKVKGVTGRYFGGLTPDIYSTVALSCIIENHAIVDFPFSIAGACPKSATVNATVGGHSGKLCDAPHFNHRGEYEWEYLIPKYYSVETIWADSAIKALKDMKSEYLLNDFDLYRLFIYGIFANRKYIFKHSISETINVKKYLNISSPVFISKFFIKLFQLSLQKINNRNIRSQAAIKFNSKNVHNFDEALDTVYKNIDYSKFLRNL